MITGNLIELATRLILVDTALLPDSTNEVLSYAKDLGKPTSRVYISHGHRITSPAPDWPTRRCTPIPPWRRRSTTAAAT